MKILHLAIIFIAGITVSLIVLIVINPFHSETVYPQMKIIGLGSTYTLGDKIDFAINFQGFEHDLCGHPRVTVLNSNQSTVWKSIEPTTLCVSSTDLNYFNRTYNLSSELGGPIVVNQTGDYSVRVSFYEIVLEKHFSVNP